MNPENQNNLMSCSGWIKRKGSKQGLWHKRFMNLSGSVLQIAKDEKSEQIESSIELSPEIKANYIENSQPPRFSVNIPNQEPLLFSTETIESASRWINSINASCLPAQQLSINQFKIISVLGRGCYGKVMLCQKVNTNELYAIKSIHKKRIMEAGKSHFVIRERDILMKSNHPFLIHLCFAFQTPSKVYLGLEYASGGKLFYYMNKVGSIPLKDVRLYIAEIALALDYLHSINVIYRDLKPENILFDDCGHIKLTDFGLSKEIPMSEKTSTFCGTSEYLSPELVMKIPYNYSIDFWALGILAYEMLNQTTPFYDDNLDKTYDNILHAEPVFPSDMDPKIVDLIKKLLSKNPSKRPTFDEIKSHPFFEGLNWDKVYNQEYMPGFIPLTSDPLLTNFDPEFTKELAIDSFTQPPICEDNNFPGFSYCGIDIENDD